MESKLLGLNDNFSSKSKMVVYLSYNVAGRADLAGPK